MPVRSIFGATDYSAALIGAGGGAAAATATAAAAAAAVDEALEEGAAVLGSPLERSRSRDDRRYTDLQ